MRISRLHHSPLLLYRPCDPDPEAFPRQSNRAHRLVVPSVPGPSHPRRYVQDVTPRADRPLQGLRSLDHDTSTRRGRPSLEHRQRTRTEHPNSILHSALCPVSVPANVPESTGRGITYGFFLKTHWVTAGKHGMGNGNKPHCARDKRKALRARTRTYIQAGPSIALPPAANRAKARPPCAA